MKTKKLLNTYVRTFMLLAGTYNGVLFSQTLSKTEQVEQVLACWKTARQQLVQQLGVSNQDFVTFSRFYKASVDSDHNAFNKMVWSGTLNLSNVTSYVNTLERKYTAMYNSFLTIKKAYPSTVAQYSAEPLKPQATCNPACDNIDFENGTLSGWNAYYGANNSNSSFNITGITGGPAGSVTQAGYDPTTATYQVKVMSGNGTDPLAPSIPLVSPFGGKYSVRLGDTTVPNQGVAILSQQFTVTSSNAGFIYQYAVLLENPSGHTYYQQPFFNVTFFDQLGDTIKCNTQLVTSSAAGFKSVFYPANGDSVSYRDWTSVLAPLTAYIGQCVTVQFKASDCALGGHFGYAYVDASCNAMTITPTAPAICNNSTTTLTAPAGAKGYKWTGPTGGIVGADTLQSVNVDSAGTYKVIMTRLFGSCTDTITTTVVKGIPPTISITSSPANDTVCTGGTIILSGNGAASYSWSGGISNGVPFSPASSGQYVVTGTAANGCSSKDSVIVVASSGALPAITVTSSPSNDSVCAGSSITLTANGASYYSWSGGVTNGTPFTPASSGQYIVTGTASNGCSNRDTVKVTVDNPIITISSTPANATICKGNSITLSGNGGLSYTWSGGITDATPFTPSSSGEYVVTGTDKFGCTGKDSVMVTVDNPAITITSSPANDTVCTGSTIILSGNGGVSYSWSGGISNGVPFSPASTGQYVVTGTDANGCSNKDSVTVVTSAGALPTITVTSSPANDTVCPGSSITLSGNGGSSYSWSGGISNGVPFSPSSTGWYVVTGTASNGCSNRDTVTVTVDRPAITIVSSPANATVCKGNSITLSGNGGVSYSWSGGITNATPFVPPSTGEYTVTGTDRLGCTGKDSVMVTIDIPVITITSSLPNDTVCPGSSITLSGNGGLTYNWTGGVTNGVPFSPSSTAQYVVTGIDTYGCSNKDSVTVVTGPSVVPTITITSTPASDSVCPGYYMTLSGNGGSSYSWTGGISDGVPFVPSVSGNYVVTGTATDGCSSKDSVYVFVKPAPAISISGTSPITAGKADTLTASGGVSYSWTSGSTSDTTMVAPATTTTYTVTATGTNGCSDTASFTVVVKSGVWINSITNVNGTNLYPNPATEMLNLTFNMNGMVMAATIKIADATGKEWIEKSVTLTGNITLPIEISSFAPGMYFVKIETNTSVKTIKFIRK